MSDSRDFTFDGKHCSLFGCTFIDDDRTTLPERTVQKIEIPGRDGTHDFDTGTYRERVISGTLYIVDDLPDSEIAVRRRAIALWLSKKGRLAFDDEPGLFYTAKVESAVSFGRSWSPGEMPVQFVCQPFAMTDIRTASAPVDMPLGTLSMDVKGTQATPCMITITNIGDIPTFLKIGRKAVIK